MKMQYEYAGIVVLHNFVRSSLVRLTGSFRGSTGAAFWVILSIKELRRICVSSARLSGRLRASRVQEDNQLWRQGANNAGNR